MACAVPSFAFFVFVVVDTAIADVQRQVYLVADAEVVDKAGAEYEYAVFVALVSVVFGNVALSVGGVVFGECPIAACTCIEDGVVAASGMVSAPPVGEVEHCIKYGTYLVEFLFVLAVYEGIVKYAVFCAYV